MTILVTGASGHLGRLVVDSLLARGVAPGGIRAGARDVSTIGDLAERGVQTVHLDYSDEASVKEAVAGAERVLLVSGNEFDQRVVQHRRVIDAAAAAGASQLVYTSAPRATTTTLFVAPEHKETEEAIVESGIPATILRNNWYNENYVGVLTQAAETGVVTSSAGEGRVASATRADYADAAAIVLTEDGHRGKNYELSGDAAWDFAELAEAIGTALARDIAYEALTPDELSSRLKAAGLDAASVGEAVTMDANIRDGVLADVTGDLACLIGRPTTPILETLRTHA